MWCKHCRQDMPAMASEPGGAVRCVRCRRPSGSQAIDAPHRRGVAELAGHGLELDDSSSGPIVGQTHSTALGQLTEPPHASPLDDLPGDWDDWLLTKELERIRRRF